MYSYAIILRTHFLNLKREIFKIKVTTLVIDLELSHFVGNF